MDNSTGNASNLIEKQALEQELSENPYSFDFFQAIRLLENLNLEKPRLGKGLRAQDDPLRLEQAVSLGFEASALTKFYYKKTSPQPYLTTNFFGLFGANGGLPLHLTEYVYDRSRHNKDDTFISFINFFQHRILSFMYRAWANGEPTVNFDRPDDDRFKYYIGSFLGLGMDSLQARDDIHDNLKLHYAGHFGCQTKHPEGLKAIIESYFKLKTTIQEFIGEWLELPDNSICRLGQSTQTGLVGINAIVGSRIWSRQHKFRIILGPMDLQTYRKLLSNSSTRRKVVSIVRNYIGFEQDWDINLVLKYSEVPPLQLGAESQLGWSSWLGNRKTHQDANDLVLNFN